MKIYRSIAEIPEDTLPRTAVALGLFDGVHLGHRAVISAVTAQKKNGLVPAVFTFSTHNSAPYSKGKLLYICTDSDRLSLFESLGVEIVFMPEFEEIKAQTASEFVEDTLAGRFKAGFVSCGFNFHFGAYGVGNTDILLQQCAARGIGVNVSDPLCADGGTISSTRIRKLILSGDMETAKDLLGAAYFISATVVRGQMLGRKLGFPTANQEIASNRVIPKYGVYLTAAEINGKCYPSITNVGVKPTIAGDRRPLAETHILDFNDILYGKTIKVSFIRFMREEKKFADLAALKMQIESDKAAVGRLARCPK